jgi:5-methylcytosine-specific restriction endonuclease McrA
MGRVRQSYGYAVVDYLKLESILGKDPSAWPRNYLVPYPTWFEDEITTFVEAVKFATKGLLEESRFMLAKINSQELMSWFVEIGQNSGQYRINSKGDNQKREKSGAKGKWPASRELEVLRRDNFCCRYCAIRLVHSKQFEKFTNLVGLSAFPNGKGNSDKHGIRLIMTATFDHVSPMSEITDVDRNVLENVVASCWSCNFGKNYFTLDELGLDFPKARKHSEEWDGLTGLLALGD